MLNRNTLKSRMKFNYFIFLFFVFTKINAQNYSTNFNVNIDDKEIEHIVKIWHNYLKTNSKEYWDEGEIKHLNNFNIFDMLGILNPSIMNWNFNNRIISLNKISEEKYLIKSIFYTDENDVFAITNSIAEKKNDQYKLKNYIFEYTKNWNRRETPNINYIYKQQYSIDEDEILKAEKFYLRLCNTFKLTPKKLTYFIAKDCDNIYDILGYEYIFSKGMSKECGYFESKNNFIFATEKGGANHYHEITHFINKYFPKANYLLLMGISAYLGKEKAHFGKPLIYHTKRVNKYLLENKQIDLSTPTSFNQLDDNTNPQYVIGALLCDLILEKGGKVELINAFKNTKTEKDLINYFNSKILKKNVNLNELLRKKINKISEEIDFPNRLND